LKENIAQKILGQHLVGGTMTAGSPVTIKIDQTLTQDATGTMAYLQFESLGIPRIKTELSVSYVDHNTLQMGFENADDHLYLQSIAAKYGILYSRAGNGICHQVHLERFGKPGKTLLGSDSHTPTGGGIGMIAIGAGGLDVAVAMAGEPFMLTYPHIVNIRLTGRLRPWVSAKDVILELLRRFSTKGNVGRIFEYSGDGVESLQVPERATITNMGAEMGVTTSIFPSDDVTRRFLRAQRRESDWIELKADPGAKYDQVEEVNLEKIEPLAAVPHSPDNVKTVQELSGMEVDQVAIGSCTNSSYKDLMIVAQILKGQIIPPHLSLVVAPGSRQVLQMIVSNGALSDIIASGARMMETTCGFCIGAGQTPKTDGISLRTNNRNFFGRAGSTTAQIYLVSPETAAASAIRGTITDPRSLGEYSEISWPDEFHIDDRMVQHPSDNPDGVEIIRGPNIGDPPQNSPLPNILDGVVTLKVGDKITTDHIMPAGPRLKYRSNIDKYAEFVFESVDDTFYRRAMQNKENRIHNVIAGRLSYGQGSSREHAAMCPMHLGVKMVIAVEIERIHRKNLVNFGIIPCYFRNADEYEKISQDDHLHIESLREQIKNADHLELTDRTRNTSLKVSIDLSAEEREIILAGGLLNYIRKR
jgi:aconitate hydratase